MSEQPAGLTLDLLGRIQAEVSEFRKEQDAFWRFVDDRMGRLETDMREVKQTLRGLTSMMATFTGRLEDLETRVDRLPPG
jgi:hypothetical protein